MPSRTSVSCPGIEGVGVGEGGLLILASTPEEEVRAILADIIDPDIPLEIRIGTNEDG